MVCSYSVRPSRAGHSFLLLYYGPVLYEHRLQNWRDISSLSIFAAAFWSIQGTLENWSLLIATPMLVPSVQLKKQGHYITDCCRVIPAAVFFLWYWGGASGLFRWSSGGFGLTEEKNCSTIFILPRFRIILVLRNYNGKDYFLCRVNTETRQSRCMKNK